MVSTRKVKDIHRLLKNIASFSDGQATVVDGADDNMDQLMVRITPNGGLYHGGTFDFWMNLSSYPESSPSVACLTKIYHPNIDCMEEEDNICLNILDTGWNQDLTLEDVVQGFLFLLYNPNLEDPLSPLFDSGTSLEEFEENVAKSLQGETIEDVDFDKNYSLGPKVVDEGVTGSKITNEEQGLISNEETDSGLGSGSGDGGVVAGNAESGSNKETESTGLKDGAVMTELDKNLEVKSTDLDSTFGIKKTDLGSTDETVLVEICSDVDRENTEFGQQTEKRSAVSEKTDIAAVITDTATQREITSTETSDFNDHSELNCDNQGEVTPTVSDNQAGSVAREETNKDMVSQQMSRVHHILCLNETGNDSTVGDCDFLSCSQNIALLDNCDGVTNSKTLDIISKYEDNLVPEVTLISNLLPKILKTLVCCFACSVKNAKGKS